MASYFTPNGLPLQFTDAGQPAASYVLHAFLAGTSTPTNIFSDDSGTVAGTSVTLDSQGYVSTSGTRHPIWLDTDITYDLEFRDATDVTVIWTAENIANIVNTTLINTRTYATSALMQADSRLAANMSCNVLAIGNTPVDAEFYISNSTDSTRYVINLNNGRYAILKNRLRVYGNGTSAAADTADLINAVLLAGSPVTLADNATIWIDDTIIIQTGSSIVGDSPNAELKLTDAANVDVIRTLNFSSLTGVGPLVNGPTNFELKNFKIDGNFLDDWQSWIGGSSTTTNNTSGSGVVIFGSKYFVDLEINNCAESAFYTEAYDYTGYTDEQSCYLALRGRVTGKDCIVFRGPADIEIGVIFYGVPGADASQTNYDANIAMSTYYPSNEVAVFVADEQRTANGFLVDYHGHHEFNTMHLYGNVSGYAYRGLNTGRLKGNHMICENCRGGAYFPTRVWGGIAMLECHNIGRQPPNYVGTLAILPDIYNESSQGFQFNATVRRSKQQAATYLTYYGSSNNHGTIARIDYFALDDSGTGLPPVGDIIELNGEDNDITLVCRNVNGDAVLVQAPNNSISVRCTDLINGSVVNRFDGATSGNHTNTFDIVATNVADVFNVDGLVTPESIKIVANLSSGQTLFSGTALDLVTRAVQFDIVSRINGVVYSSRRHGTENLDNTVTTEQTISFDHNFFTTPQPDNVKFGLYDPGSSYAGSMDYIYLRSVDATQLTFVYKLGTTGINGPLILLWSVEI